MDRQYLANDGVGGRWVKASEERAGRSVVGGGLGDIGPESEGGVAQARPCRARFGAAIGAGIL